MTLQEAIAARHSVRQYIEKPIEADAVARLSEEIAFCNQEGRLHIQLVLDEPKAFAGGMVRYGRFKGVRNYLAMVGPKGADEAIGYYGQRIVLLAQTLGLNSCWVGLSVGKQPGRYAVDPGEKLHCVVALGYGESQGVQHPMRPVENFVKAGIGNTGSLPNGRVPMPDWFQRGVEAAVLAPTAVHQQRFELELVDGHTAAARARFSLVGWARLDLGIVKCNFEVAAGRENFEWQEIRN